MATGNRRYVIKKKPYKKNYERKPGTWGSSGNTQTCAFDARDILPTAPRVIFIEAVGAKGVSPETLENKQRQPNRVTKRLWFHSRECLLDYLMHTQKRK